VGVERREATGVDLVQLVVIERHAFRQQFPERGAIGRLEAG